MWSGLLGIETEIVWGASLYDEVANFNLPLHKNQESMCIVKGAVGLTVHKPVHFLQILMHLILLTLTSLGFSFSFFFISPALDDGNLKGAKDVGCGVGVGSLKH